MKLETEVIPNSIPFLHGHLAILFGMLIRSSSTSGARTQIIDGLPGGGRRVKVEGLIEQAGDISSFYSLVGGGDEDGDVVKDVVRYLEKLVEEM